MEDKANIHSECGNVIPEKKTNKENGSDIPVKLNEHTRKMS
jgi:hypothetical protein